MFYNGKAAVVMGSLVAAAAMICFMFDFLPGWMRDMPDREQPRYLGAWCSTLGILVCVLILCFRRPRDVIFLDRLCINQYDEREKTLGVMSLGACLKHSKRIMILWDDTFCHRLWCLFELAAFLKTHDSTELLVVPLDLTNFLFWNFVLNALIWGGSLVVPYTTDLSGNVLLVLIFVLGTCAQCWLATTNILHFSKGAQAIQKQLSSFTVAGAQCYCCSANHQTRDGQDIACDRRIMQKCIQHWFGSVEEFEKVVQTRVRDATMLKTQMSRFLCLLTYCLTYLLTCVIGKKVDLFSSKTANKRGFCKAFWRTLLSIHLVCCQPNHNPMATHGQCGFKTL